MALLEGKSLYAVAKEALPSRSTIRRWWGRLQDQFHAHKDSLCVLISELGKAAGSIKTFWLTLFKTISLASAMRLCHISGVVIP